MTASGTRLINSFRVDPDLREGEVVGSRVTCADGREFSLPHFPKRIRDVTEGARDGEVVCHLAGGRRYVLREQELLEAAATSATIEHDVAQLIESGELDEAVLEAAFNEELTEYFVTHRGIFPHPPRSGTVGFVDYSKHPGGGESHKAFWFHHHVGTFGSQDEAAKALRAHHKANKHRLNKHGELVEAGPHGGASEAEMRARAMSYPAHQGGIGSSKREDIGHGIGRKYPPGFQHIRNAIIRRGKSVAAASRIAYGALRRWRSGEGDVKPETRAKAAKVLGELEVGGKTSRAKKVVTQEATTGLREAIRSRKGLERALATYLSDRGDSRPVSEDPESLREAAQRAISGHGPLKARSQIDQRVLDAQARATITNSYDSVMVEATRTQTTVSELEHGLHEDEPPSDTTGGVFVALPPEKGTMPTVVVDEDTSRIGEVTVPRELDQTDLGELQEQAIALYNRTAAPTHQGRSYLSSAGRVELTQLVAALREALTTVTPTPSEPIGGPTPAVPMRLPSGEAPPANLAHPPEDLAYADAALRRSGYSRDGRSAQGDYLQSMDLYPAGTVTERALTEGERLRECMIHVTTPSGKRYSREMGTVTRAHQAAKALRSKGHKVSLEGMREGQPEQAGRAAAARALQEARKSRKRCPVCAQQLPVGAQRCPGCGNTLDTELDSDDAKIHRKIRQKGVIEPDELPDSHPLAIQESTKPSTTAKKKATRGSSSRHAELGRHGVTLHRLGARVGRSPVYHVRAPGQSLGVITRRENSLHAPKGDGAFHAIPRLKSGGFSRKATAHTSVPEAAMALARHHGIGTLLEGHRGKLMPSDIHGYGNVRGGKIRAVEPMTDDKLAHFAAHPETHPELRKRVKAEISRRKKGGKRAPFVRSSRPPGPRQRRRKIAEANWMAGAVKRPGQLHRDLNIPEDQNIPLAVLHKAAASHEKPEVRARARLALTFHKHRTRAREAAAPLAPTAGSSRATTSATARRASSTARSRATGQSSTATS